MGYFAVVNMEILSLRAGICCQGETKASPFDKLAVVTVRRKGKKKHLRDRYWKMVIHQGLVNWLGNKLMTLLSVSETFTCIKSTVFQVQ